MFCTALILLVAAAGAVCAETRERHVVHELSNDALLRARERSESDVMRHTSNAIGGDVDAQWKMALYHYATGLYLAQRDPPDTRTETLHFRAARLWWQMLYAQHDDASAAFNLGVLFWSGRGMTKDESMAIAWFLQAAEREHALALFVLGEYHYFELDDTAQAFAYWTRAAAAGHAEAQFNCGSLFTNTVGLPHRPDWSKAMMYFRMAAEQNHTRAQKALDKFKDPCESEIFAHFCEKRA